MNRCPGKHMAFKYPNLHQSRPHQASLNVRLRSAWPISLTTDFCAHNLYLINTCCSYVKNNDQIRSQFCICHDNWVVVTCAKLWLGWYIRIMAITNKTITSLQSWAHKHLMTLFHICKIIKYCIAFLSAQQVVICAPRLFSTVLILSVGGV